MKDQQDPQNKKDCCQSLSQADHNGLFSDLFQLRDHEFGPDGEGNKAQRQIGDQIQIGNRTVRDESQAFYAQPSQAARPDQDRPAC